MVIMTDLSVEDFLRIEGSLPLSAKRFRTRLRTDEEAITLAIARTASVGRTICLVPDSMLPYDASLVTFNSSVRMVREGSNWSVFDVVAYGADDLGVIDSSTEIQAAHDNMPTTGGILFFPEGTYLTGTVLTFTRDNLTVQGQGAQATILLTNGNDLMVCEGPNGSTGVVQRLHLFDFTIQEGATANTTSVGIDITAYPVQSCSVERLRLFGFGGGEMKIAGGSNFLLKNNYFSHNKASGTGSALYVFKHAQQGAPTTYLSEGNYFASTVSGADEMMHYENVVGLVSINDIFELVPAGVVGCRIEATAGESCTTVIFIKPHFEGITGTGWEMHDVTGAIVLSSSGETPALSWSAVAAADRYIIEMGANGTVDMRNLRRALFGLSGPNDFSGDAAIQIGPIRSATDALAAFSIESATVNRGGFWQYWGNDTGGTRRQIGRVGVDLKTADAAMPEGRFRVSLSDAGGSLGVRADIDDLGIILGTGGDKFETILTGSATWDPASLADGATATTTVTVTGAKVSGTVAFASLNQITVGGWQITADCTAANTVTITLTNHTGGTVDLGSGTVRVVAFNIA